MQTFARSLFSLWVCMKSKINKNINKYKSTNKQINQDAKWKSVTFIIIANLFLKPFQLHLGWLQFSVFLSYTVHKFCILPECSIFFLFFDFIVKPNVETVKLWWHIHSLVKVQIMALYTITWDDLSNSICSEFFTSSSKANLFWKLLFVFHSEHAIFQKS